MPVWCNPKHLSLDKQCELSKHFFTAPTDAHNYKIIGMLKTIKIPTIHEGNIIRELFRV